MVVPDPEEPEFGRVKILDFGIAKLIDSSVQRDMTRVGVLLGTPAYMAPEQCRAEAVDPRVDVYSLGVVLYEMCAGRSPFQGEHFHEVLLRQQTHVPPSLAQVRRDLPSRLAALVQRMLVKDSRERPDMAQCAHELEALCAARFASSPKVAPETSEASRPLLKRTLAKLVRLTSSSADSENPAWQPLYRSLPLPMSTTAEVAARFLGGAFKSCEQVSEGVVRLLEPRKLEGGSYDFFAVFPQSPGGSASSSVLPTRSFVDQTHNLAQYLERLQATTVKVVLVFTESLELGRGVREKILEYRQRFSALVLPLYLGEIRRTPPERTADLLIERVRELHSTLDPYETTGPLTDPMRFFGMRTQLNQLIGALSAGTQPCAVALLGQPGSGKTSLLNMLEYYMPSMRFVRIALGRKRIDSANQLMQLLREGLRGNGAGTTEEQDTEGLSGLLADLKRHSERTTLVLEGADDLFSASMHPSLASGDAAVMGNLFEQLAALVREGTLRLLLTGAELSWLSLPHLVNGPNPLLGYTRWLRMRCLNFAECSKLLSDLGLQINFSFHPAALRAIHRCSGGNVTLILRLASTVVSQNIERSDHHLLNQVVVSRRNVTHAAETLIGRYDTFAGSLLPHLSSEQQQALRAVVFAGPSRARILATLRHQFGSMATIGHLMDGLCQLGLCSQGLGRVYLCLPLLEHWIRTHQEPLPAHASNQIQPVTFYIGLMSASTTLAAVLYAYAWFFLHSLAAKLLFGVPGLLLLGLVFARYSRSRGLERPRSSTDQRPLGASKAGGGLVDQPNYSLRIFCSYSREDQAHAQNLGKHISMLRREGIVSWWHDEHIEPGMDWRKEIKRRFDEANVILLLISADFTNSDFCHDEELRRARQRHQDGSARIIPIIVRDVAWQDTWIGTLQALPQGGKPVSQWADDDAAWAEVARTIRRISQEPRWN